VVPDTIGGIVVLVLLVLPGLAFELMRQRRSAGRDDSTFVEVSRILVAGLALGAVTSTLLAFVSLIGPRSIVSLYGLFTSRRWITEHLLVSGWTAWAYGLLSVTLAALTAAISPGMSYVGLNHAESGWVTAFDRLPRLMKTALELPETPIVRLSVRLTDGTVYVGDRAEFSVGSSPEARELLLAGELLSRPPGSSKAEPVSGWHRILLREDQISDILIQYVPGSSPTALPRRASQPMNQVRHGVSKLLRVPAHSTWRELLEAPTTHPTAAVIILAIEMLILVTTGIVSRLM
jgi:hypothetical protein